MSKQQDIVTEILNELEKGTPKPKIMARIVKRWQVSDRTFERRYKEAGIKHQDRQNEANELASKAYLDAKVNAAVGAVMSNQERKEILTQIARGEIPLTKPMVIDGAVDFVPVVPDWMDRRNAIAELNKMDGSYAPTKLANTDTDGNNLPATINIRVIPTIAE